MSISNNVTNNVQNENPSLVNEVTTDTSITNSNQISNVRDTASNALEQTQESLSKSFQTVSSYILMLASLAAAAAGLLATFMSIFAALKQLKGKSNGESVYPPEIENYFNQNHPDMDIAEMTPEQVESQIRLDGKTYNDKDFQDSTEDSIKDMLLNNGIIKDYNDIDALCKTLLLKYKTRIPKSIPNSDRIRKYAAKGVSYDLWRTLLIQYQCRPYCYKKSGQTYIGAQHKVPVKSEFLTKYPEREESASFMNDYFNMFNTHSFEKWEQYQTPSLMPLKMQQELLIEDIQKCEKLINSYVVNVVLTQNQFDGLVWWLFNLEPAKLIKTIKSMNVLAGVGDDVVVEYVQNWFPISQMTVETQRKNTIFENIYRFNTYPIVAGNLYVQLFEEGYMIYCYNRDHEPSYLDQNLTFFETFNESLAHARTVVNMRRLGPLTDVTYPVPDDETRNLGIRDTGINTDNTICYGWYGSPRAHKTKLHFGVDLVCRPGKFLYAPYTGVVWKIMEATGADVEPIFGVDRLNRIVILPDINKNVLVSLYYTYPRWSLLGDSIPDEPTHFRFYDIGTVTVNNGGVNYLIGDIVTFLNGSTARVSAITNVGGFEGVVVELEILSNIRVTEFDNRPEGENIETTTTGFGSGLTVDIEPRANYEIFEGDTIVAGDIIGTVGNNIVLDSDRVNNFVHVQYDWSEKGWSGSAVDGIKLNTTAIWSEAIKPIILFVEEDTDLLSGGFVNGEDETTFVSDLDGRTYPARVLA